MLSSPHLVKEKFPKISLKAKISVFITLPWAILLNILIINYPFNYSVEPFNKIAQGRVMNTENFAFKDIFGKFSFTK